MKRLFGILLIIYGVGLSSVFGTWAVKDNLALENAVRLDQPQAELRHRINVGFEGVWFLLSNLIAISGVCIVSQAKK